MRKIVFYTHSLQGGGGRRLGPARLGLQGARRGRRFRAGFRFARKRRLSRSRRRSPHLGNKPFSGDLRLARLIRREKPDVIASALCASNLKLVAAAALAGALDRVVISYHGYFDAEPRTLSRLSYLLTPLLTRLAARTVCVSNALRDDLVDVWRAAASRTRRLYNPIATDGGAPDASIPPLAQRPPPSSASDAWRRRRTTRCCCAPSPALNGRTRV